MKIRIPFGLHFYQDRSLPVNAQKLINFFIEAQPADSKAPVVLNNTPGSQLWATVGNGPIHGLLVLGDLMYVVSGTELYSIDVNKNQTLLGTIAGNSRVSMAQDGTQLVIVNGTYGYVYDATNGLQQITDAAFYPTSRVVYLQQRFLFQRDGTRQFFSSTVDDATTYNGLYFDQMLTDPSKIVSILSDHGEIWLFGTVGTEIWTYNHNESQFSFSRLEGSFVEKGCAAKHSPAKIDNSFYWLGNDLVIYRADGYKPTRISTHAIENKIKGYSDIANAYAFTWSEQGHYFYEITFPGDATWRYDASTGLWHQAMYGNSGTYHATAHCYFNNLNMIGDSSGVIHYLDMDLFQDNANTIYRTATTPHIHSGRLRATMDRLEIDIVSGEGLTVGQGSDPQLMMRYTDDGGRTWSSQRWANMGRIGEYTRRVRYQNLGMFYQRAFEITVSDPIKAVVIDAFAYVDVDDVYD